MIKNIDEIKKVYEKEIITFINTHKELCDLIEKKYLHYATDLNYSKSSKSYIFNITFTPDNINEPDITIPLLIKDTQSTSLLSIDTEEDELKVVNYIKGIIE